ncbi:hypothetical protein PV11_04905 [Exophiala sideris]|uniref:Carboxylesterase type B domain-containing protein n=1 Tax=Exophiala sideris TaxID=1016849 RepID=A0A0D1YIX6_9EURO|nr:hypothetical protein PV11_04905 [Exophiala sideris]
MAAVVQHLNHGLTLQKDVAAVTAAEVSSEKQHLAAILEQASIKINALQINGFINSTTNVANFLNIPYARIPARFCEASLINPRKEAGIIDATKYGPCCPQPFDVIHDLTGHLYPKVIDASNSAEFTCLSINVYAPPSVLTSQERLPVLVWIHGGAFTYGDASDEYDGNYIVQHSVSISKPIIVASLNYRVGPYGFLTSKEIKDDAQSRGENGYANLGFHDQRLGLQWIQQNIGFFGGNGYELTAAGESAGAMSILMHIRSNFPAFQRAFILSAASFKPVPLSVAQDRFDALIAKMGIAPTAPAGDKLAALRSLTCEELNRLNGPGVSFPIYDSDFSPELEAGSFLESNTPFPSWLKGVVIGSTSEEAALFLLKGLTGLEAVSLVKAVYGDTDFTRELLKKYEFVEDNVPGSGTDSLIRLTTDGAFANVANAIASDHSEIPVSLYSFEQKDPFEQSLWRGRAFHSLGNSMLFRLPTVAGPNVDLGTRITSDKFSDAVISLTNSQQPWESYGQGQDHTMMVFDGERSGIVKAEKARWTDLTQTQERWELFKTNGLSLISQNIVAANS